MIHVERVLEPHFRPLLNKIKPNIVLEKNPTLPPYLSSDFSAPSLSSAEALRSYTTPQLR